MGGGAYGMYGVQYKCVQILVRKPEGIDYFEGLNLAGSVGLKWILKK